MRIKHLTILFAMLCLALPASAQDNPTSDIGYRGWGFRLGVSSDPDQALGGFHFDFGEFTRNLRFQPALEAGFGDDVFTLFATLPVHYRFVGADDRFTPYAGGGIAFGFVDVDLPPMATGDDTDFEVGARATGGLEWNYNGGNRFAVELNLGVGDVQDAQILAVWNF